jgi:hypothetical protein
MKKRVFMDRKDKNSVMTLADCEDIWRLRPEITRVLKETLCGCSLLRTFSEDEILIEPRFARQYRVLSGFVIIEENIEIAKWLRSRLRLRMM